MSYNLSGVASYVNKLSDNVITKSVYNPDLIANVNLVNSTIGTVRFPIVENTIVSATDSSCGWNPQNSVVVTEVELTTTAYVSQGTLCATDLANYWNDYQAFVAWKDNKIPFEQYFLEDFGKRFEKKIANDVWDKLLTNGLGATSSGVPGCTVSFVNDDECRNSIYKLYKNLDLDVKGEDDLICYLSDTYFDDVAKAFIGQNLVHYNPGEPQNEITIPGMKFKVKRAKFPSGYNAKVILGRKKFAIVANDRNTKASLNMEARTMPTEIRYEIKYTLGAQPAVLSHWIIGV